MAANWKKIILSGSDANLNEITASQGIQLDSTLTAATDATYDIIVADSVTGDLRVRDQSDVGSEGSSVNSFVTMSVGEVNITTSTQNDTLNITSSLGNPLTTLGVDATNTITITVATASKEIVEDTAASMFTGGNVGFTEYSSNHEGITFHYDDAGDGTFSITGSSDLTQTNTTGQAGVELYFNPLWLSANISQSEATASGLDLNDNVTFVNITSSYYSAQGLGDGNISQTTNLSVPTDNVYYDTDLTPSEVGQWVSASALYITNSAHIGNDLTMSGDFIFQGFVFDDAQVLVHSGGNEFGSGSTETSPWSNNAHQFTGSIFITGSDITLQQSHSFNGDGSGLTNLSLSSLEGLGLLSGSAQIASDISGAFSFTYPSLRTASLTDGTVSAITASGTTVLNASVHLASGKQIWTFISASDSDFLDDIAAEYIISASANDTSGLDIVTIGAIGSGPLSQTIALNISKSAEETLVGGDHVMFRDASHNNLPLSTRRISVNNLAAFITGSTEGTVTEILAGNGISVTNPTGYDGTTVVNTTIDILLSGSEGNPSNNANTITVDDVGGHTLSNLIIESDNDLGLNPLLNITKITTTGEGVFSYLKVTDPNSLTSLDVATVSIKDNFMYLNSDLGEVDPTTAPINDAGISINRGNLNDANLFWDESIARWSLSTADLQTSALTSSIPNSNLVPTSVSSTNPSAYPLYGINADGNTISDTAAVGQIHINTNATEVWIYA